MRRTSLGVILLIAAAGMPAPGAAPPFTRIDAAVTMSDGVALDASLFVPAKPIRAANGKLPLVVRQHGGGSNKDNTYDASYGLEYVKTGKFALLMYSARGHGNSGGLFDFFGPRTTQDLSEILNWAARTRRDVDTNNVGVEGFSQGGAGSLLPAENDARIKAVAVGNTFDDLNHALNPNDCFKFAFAVGIFTAAYKAGAALTDDTLAGRWGAQLITDTEDVGAGPLPSTTEDLRGRSPLTFLRGNPDRTSPMYRNGLRVPVFWATAWEDQLFPPDMPLAILADLRSRRIPVHLWFSSGGHGAGPDFPADVRAKEAAMLAWMDEFLRGADRGFRAGRRPAVDYWERIEAGEPGTWVRRTTSAWPARGMARFYPDGTTLRTAPPANRSTAVGTIVNDLASLNVANDAIARELLVRKTGIAELGAVLDAAPESANPIDTVRYASAPLTKSLHLLGPAGVRLPVTTTALRVAQVDAKLWDSSPAGDRLIARACRSVEAPSERLDLRLWPAAHTFPAGHRIVLTLSTVDFPTFKPDVEPQQTTILTGARLDLPIGY